jgi:hypothetical protein
MILYAVGVLLMQLRILSFLFNFFSELLLRGKWWYAFSRITAKLLKICSDHYYQVFLQLLLLLEKEVMCIGLCFHAIPQSQQAVMQALIAEPLLVLLWRTAKNDTI